MPVLIAFLRQYGLKEYALTLSIAGVCGLGIAVLINASSGSVAGGQALLKTKAQIQADDTRLLTTHVYKPAPAVHPRRHRAHRRRHVVRHPSQAQPAPAAARLVATRKPAPAQTPAVVRQAPAPRPVVRAPAPKPAPAPQRTSSGRGQFDDSG